MSPLELNVTTSIAAKFSEDGKMHYGLERFLLSKLHQ